MYYVDARRLVDLAVEHEILAEKDDCIPIYREAGSDPEEFPEGWYLTPKEEVYHDIMYDETGQTALVNALKERGVEFSPAKFLE